MNKFLKGYNNQIFENKCKIFNKEYHLGETSQFIESDINILSNNFFSNNSF